MPELPLGPRVNAHRLCPAGLVAHLVFVTLSNERRTAGWTLEKIGARFKEIVVVVVANYDSVDQSATYMTFNEH